MRGAILMVAMLLAAPALAQSPDISARRRPEVTITRWYRRAGMSQKVKGFGRRPFATVGLARGPAPKASQGGNRGEVGDRLASVPMGI